MTDIRKASRDEHRRKKELEEQRKLGNAPAEVDEEGRDINPHIPQYITKVPFFYGATGPTLRHQRVLDNVKKDYDGIDARQKRGVKKDSRATRYRKGACQNCGAMTHKKADCLERPRKIGAQFSNTNIAPDEHLPQDLKLSFDGKRDRWADYDIDQHKKVIAEYERIEQERRRLRAEELNKKDQEKAEAAANGETIADPVAAEDSDSDSDDDEQDRDEMKYADDADMAGSKVDTKRRITVRNLRMREDTAKYLLNLDPNSAHYDPKTRSMRANPLAHTGKEASGLPYAGDNFVRYSGDVSKVAERQLFAWEAADKGANIHLQADPTKAELMHKNFKVNKEGFKEQQRESLLDKYGGQEHLQAPPKELLLAQTEQYVTYTKSGKPIGQERAKVLSRYEEDVHPGNHRSVWGSYWRNGRWGYACCHSFEKPSYCTGERGKAARAAKPTDLLASAAAAHDGQKKQGEEEAPPKSLVELHREKEGRKDAKRSHSEAEGAAGGDGGDKRTREQRIADFMKKHKEEEAAAERMMAKGERERGYNSAKRDYKEVSEEEMEAYRLARVHKEDPMAAYMDK